MDVEAARHAVNRLGEAMQDITAVYRACYHPSDAQQEIYHDALSTIKKVKQEFEASPIPNTDVEECLSLLETERDLTRSYSWTEWTEKHDLR